jgi:hypothetical protein
MFTRIRGLAALAVLALVVGCAEIPSVPYDRSTAHVTNIEVLGPAVDPHATVFQAAMIGQSFGLIGGLIDAGIQVEREKRLAAVLTAQGYRAADAFPKALTPALQAKGYTVTYGDAKREHPLSLVTEFPAAAAGTDAYLDVVVDSYGYLLTGMAAQFRPFLYVTCKLESAVQYNPLQSSKSIVAISANPVYQFDRVDDMEADPKKTTAGLDDAFGQVSGTIATLLQ